MGSFTDKIIAPYIKSSATADKYHVSTRKGLCNFFVLIKIAYIHKIRNKVSHWVCSNQSVPCSCTECITVPLVCKAAGILFWIMALEVTPTMARTLPSEIYLEMRGRWGKGHFSLHCLNFRLFPPAHPYVWSMNGSLSLYRKILGNRPQTVTVWVISKPCSWSKGKITDVCTQRRLTVHRPLSLAVPSKSYFYKEQ